MTNLKKLSVSMLLGLAVSAVALGQNTNQTQYESKRDSCCAMEYCCCSADSCDNAGNRTTASAGDCCCKVDSCPIHNGSKSDAAKNGCCCCGGDSCDKSEQDQAKKNGCCCCGDSCEMTKKK